MRAESPAAPGSLLHPPEVISAGRVRAKDWAALTLLTAAAIFVHGYHPFVEDAEIYIPGVKKLLNPALFPFNDVFFASHAKLTLFPNLIAWSVRLAHLPLEWLLLIWHFTCIFLLLLASWKLARLCFGTARSAWGGAALMAALLTIPVAGTALYIMDQYLNPRSFSTVTVTWIVVNLIQKHYRWAIAWLIITAVVHPLMAGFGLVFVVLLAWRQHATLLITPQSAAALILFPMGLFPPVSNAYRQVLDSHSYFFLLRWEWYEWLGIIGPLVILWWFGRIARSKGLANLEVICSAAVIFGVLFLVAGLVVTAPPKFARFVELQPMRSVHLIYILLVVFSGGLLAEYVLKTELWRWLTMSIPLCAGMFYAQRQLFPATPHLEWPGAKTSNEWVRAFVWIRDNTPVDAYFALDPEHMRRAGQDQHGFRAIAERSMLADRVKDSGAVTMFPALAQTWLEQVRAQQGWNTFAKADFERLHQGQGVNWVVFQRPNTAGLDCPYQNAALLICAIGHTPQRPVAQ